MEYIVSEPWSSSFGNYSPSGSTSEDRARFPRPSSSDNMLFKFTPEKRDFLSSNNQSPNRTSPKVIDFGTPLSSCESAFSSGRKNHQDCSDLNLSLSSSFDCLSPNAKYYERNAEDDTFGSNESKRCRSVSLMDTNVFDEKHDIDLLPSKGISAHESSNFKIRKPIPDQGAFEMFRQVECSSKPPPATPVRHSSHTPSRDRDLQIAPMSSGPAGGFGYFNHLQEALTSTKVLFDSTLNSSTDLLDHSGASEGSAISFHNDFDDVSALGEGAFAEVRMVRERSSGQNFAVKRSKKAFRGLSMQRLYTKEVTIMSKVCAQPCPYVSQMVRAWQEGGHLHMQMELAANGTLADLMTKLNLRSEHFSAASVWRVLHDVGMGLKHVHSCGIVHLDVKPSNVLISADGKLLLGDFGMAHDLALTSDYKDGCEGDNR